MKTIQIFSSSQKGLFAMVDESDFATLSEFKWCAARIGKTHYAVAKIGGKTRYMHRLIMGSPKSRVVDHMDRDGLNNQRSNLRIATTSQNIINSDLRKNNSSGFTGVAWLKTRNKWVAYITVMQKRIYLGVFCRKEEALAARIYAEKQHFGQFSSLKLN